MDMQPKKYLIKSRYNNLFIMKHLKTVLILLGILSLFSCSKDDDTPIKYIKGGEYIQTFYHRSAEIVEPPNVKIGILTSICNSIHYTIYDYDENFNTINPPQDLIDKVEELNSNNNNKILQYFLVANIKFCYYDQCDIKNISLKSDWEIVVGGIKKYSINGALYKNLIIVDGFKPLFELLPS